MAPTCGTVTSSRRPAYSPTRSLLDKAEEAVAATSTKAAALAAGVAAGVAVVAIRTAAVTMDVVDADTTNKALGTKVRTIKGTKAPTTKVTRALITKAVGAGPATAGPTTRRTLLRYSLTLKTLNNMPVPGTDAHTRHRDGTNADGSQGSSSQE